MKSASEKDAGTLVYVPHGESNEQNPNYESNHDPSFGFQSFGRPQWTICECCWRARYWSHLTCRAKAPLGTYLCLVGQMGGGGGTVAEKRQIQIH